MNIKEDKINDRELIKLINMQIYKRNSDVVAEIFERTNGVCERYGVASPFIRGLDGTPYLEVHRKERLADGGEDTVENVLVACQNYHRELHCEILRV